MDAIDIFGRTYTTDEIFDIVNKDKAYYIASGGGVTIGGGEATMQPEFTGALIKKCRDNGIHVAIDTCGYTVSDESLRCLEQADLLLYDLKGSDPEQHRKNTGVSNELILKNLRHLSGIGKEIIIRLPIIPGRTDSDENIIATAELLSKLKSVIRVDLIAYHEYGKIKYEQRGETYPMEGSPQIGDDRMNEIKKMLEDRGLSVQIGG
jgi:pyruvate formate lyase activating enzyme